MSGERSSANARDNEPVVAGVTTTFHRDGTVTVEHSANCWCLECYLRRNKETQARLHAEQAAAAKSPKKRRR
jgi:hypothetical protein